MVLLRHPHLRWNSSLRNWTMPIESRMDYRMATSKAGKLVELLVVTSPITPLLLWNQNAVIVQISFCDGVNCQLGRFFVVRWRSKTMILVCEMSIGTKKYKEAEVRQIWLLSLRHIPTKAIDCSRRIEKKTKKCEYLFYICLRRSADGPGGFMNFSTSTIWTLWREWIGSSATWPGLSVLGVLKIDA